ncbi:MAG: bifunctional demethylmenaquinone methyltransferase/2-methoxy-6-polyprenyl-1,4-benzoquinol methylase UbiE [Flavobacteriaceae bacterium]|nr:bifunctional demethylmenaquinone methyltransferase/2-methoxy-6-polyprenyl-1,4-benzoquinol methylase UbiE [Flavobacteriaceae bacterium]MCY4268215.1 bifunctional demethylmenaquinone methyltransferase/2-methoxy-6-polyprenyl-1,4-benzoquinol methylase UbiE [Flavobacteriaceae bacterium]MCY4300070.1 bifunctional demethylmenaquinone methyltransferase/2-methoxy-6-polyprenyl-1,4-benzoquinol methylase UbiE [Flavobacteriaceae bacterium]
MNQNVLPNHNDSKEKQQQVEEMFDRISVNYDRLNRIITFGMYVRWQKKVAQLVEKESPRMILDLATGTADFAIAVSHLPKVKIIGVDISKKMLGIGHLKVQNANLQKVIDLQVGSAESLNFKDETFEVVIVSFGLRNFQNLDKALKEIFRVIKKGGCLIALETSRPNNWFINQMYQFYTVSIMPFITNLLFQEKLAYRYLSNSALSFLSSKQLIEIKKNTGFVSVDFKPQLWNISGIYISRK